MPIYTAAESALVSRFAHFRAFTGFTPWGLCDGTLFQLHFTLDGKNAADHQDQADKLIARVKRMKGLTVTDSFLPHQSGAFFHLLTFTVTVRIHELGE